MNFPLGLRRARTIAPIALCFAAASCASAQVPDTAARADSGARLTDTVASRPTGPLRLEASLSARKLYLYQGDARVAEYDIAVGMDQHPTPTGRFSIRKIVWNPDWRPPDAEWARNRTPKPAGHPANPMKLVKMFFQEPDYYIHGTDDLQSLGAAESHGCLRMHPNDAAAVARYVMENGGQPRPESWFRRVFRFRDHTQVIYLRRPVGLTITG